MKKLILILTSFISSHLIAQDSTYIEEYKHSAQFTFGGIGLYALGYERLLVDNKQDISAEFGYSYTGNLDFKMAHNFLISGNYIIGTKASRLEVGPSLNLFTNDEYKNAKRYPWIYDDHRGSRFRLFYGARIGYRLQIPNKKFLLKVHYIPFFEYRDEASGIFHMGSLTLGKRF